MSNMSSAVEEEEGLINIEKMSIDQFAGSVVLILGAVGSLLLVIWQSRCACKCRIGCSDKCYLFDCSREPPPPMEDEESTTAGDAPAPNAETAEQGEQIAEPEPEPEPLMSGKKSKRSLNQK